MGRSSTDKDDRRRSSGSRREKKRDDDDDDEEDRHEDSGDDRSDVDDRRRDRDRKRRRERSRRGDDKKDRRSRSSRDGRRSRDGKDDEDSDDGKRKSHAKTEDAPSSNDGKSDDDGGKVDKRDASSDNDDDSSQESRRRRRRKSKSRRKKRSSRRDKRKRRKKRRKYESSSSDSSSSESSSSSSDSSSSDSSSDDDSDNDKEKVVNRKLMAKLEARGETLEERKERRAQRRAAKISTRFGYTAEENPFNDPNLHETFTWGRKAKLTEAEAKDNVDTLDQIDNIRLRREERFRERDEMERLRAEESRMKELEHYDEWAKKEEAFHLQQQRQRSAIRLVEGRQKPIDVLAKNLLLFGYADNQASQAKVKYQERHNPLTEMQDLQAELEEPSSIVKMLKLAELRGLLSDLEAFRALEKEAGNSSSSDTAVVYWDSLHLVVSNEIKLLQNGGAKGSYGTKVKEIESLFKGQSQPALLKMKAEVEARLQKMAHGNGGAGGDRSYWRNVHEQLGVHLSKMTLSDIHSKMLVRQLERLEQKRDALKKKGADSNGDGKDSGDGKRKGLPDGVSEEFGNDEQEMGEADEITQANTKKSYSWQRKYKGRKPRYFNRVKTGYDWNKYNQTHYDHDNPPPKIVQGYKFNIFYPELVDPTKTPQYFIETADSDEFCIIRFHGGAPYEDIAFKIINKEWNRSRKRGFKCSFQRGILSVCFNFKSHWYRR